MTTKPAGALVAAVCLCICETGKAEAFPGSALESEAYLQERTAAHTSTTDVPDAVAKWQFIRRFGTGINGLSKEDKRLVAAIAGIDRAELEEMAVRPTMASMCRQYEAQQLDVVGAARMIDIAQRAQDEALDAEIRRLLESMSVAGRETLARSEAAADFIARQRRTRDWEGFARDAPGFMHVVIRQACLRLAGQHAAPPRGNGTQDVVRMSGRAKGGDIAAIRQSIQDALRAAGERTSDSNGFDIQFGKRRQPSERHQDTPLAHPPSEN